MEEEKCTCGHTKKEHANDVAGFAGYCQHGWDIRKNICFCQFYSTILNTCGLSVGVVTDEPSEDEDGNEDK